MGIGLQGAKAANFYDHIDDLKRLSNAFPNASDQYPIEHFREFARLNRLPLGEGIGDGLRKISTKVIDGEIHHTVTFKIDGEDNGFGTDTFRTVLPEKTRAMIVRSVERFGDSPAIMVREAEEKLGIGAGLFKTVPVVLKGTFQEKCNAVEQAAISVYTSFYSIDGIAYYAKHQSRGMGLLIEPVVGSVVEHDGERFIMPAFSGTAYANSDGSGLLVRVVAGLGTAAVAGGGMLFRPDEWDGQPMRIAGQEFAEAISLRTGKIGKIPLSSFALKDYLFNPESLSCTLNGLGKNAKLYLEWSTPAHGGSAGPIILNQLADDIEQAPAAIGGKGKKWQGIKLAEGDDFYNTGRRECKGVVYVGSLWGGLAKRTVDAIGQLMNGHLLVIDATPLTLAEQNGEDTHASLTYASICNCAGVWQYMGGQVEELSKKESEMKNLMAHRTGVYMSAGHSTKAATHFAGICKSEKILFLSAHGDPDIFFKSGRIMELNSEKKDSMMLIRIFNAAAMIKHDEKSGKSGLWANTDIAPYSDKEWGILAKKIERAVSELEASGDDDMLDAHQKKYHEKDKIRIAINLLHTKLTLMFEELGTSQAQFNGMEVSKDITYDVVSVGAAISFYKLNKMMAGRNPVAEILPTRENIKYMDLRNLRATIEVGSTSPEFVESGALAYLQALYEQMKEMPEWGG